MGLRKSKDGAEQTPGPSFQSHAASRPLRFLVNRGDFSQSPSETDLIFQPRQNAERTTSSDYSGESTA